MFTPQTYLLALTQAATKTMTCAGVDMLLALDSNVLLAGPSTLLQGPSLLAIVGVLDPFHVTCSVGLLVFTRPDGAGGIRVTVHDPGGTVIYAGAGATSGDAITLEVRTVASPGAATVAIKGVLTSAGLEMTDAKSATPSRRAVGGDGLDGGGADRLPVVRGRRDGSWASTPAAS